MAIHTIPMVCISVRAVSAHEVEVRFRAFTEEGTPPQDSDRTYLFLSPTEANFYQVGHTYTVEVGEPKGGQPRTSR